MHAQWGCRAASGIMGAMEDVAEIAERLYGLLPEEFTAARDAEAKRIRGSGDRESASAIAACAAPPSRPGWSTRSSVTATTRSSSCSRWGRRCGRRSRGSPATRSGRWGGSDSRCSLPSAVRRRALARELGHPVSEDVGLEVEQTLGAAMADAGIAEAVRSGRLTSPTSYAGLGLDGGTPAPAPRRLSVVKDAPAESDTGRTGKAGRKSTAPDADEQARRREEEARRREAERRAAELEQARAEAAEAEQAYEEAAAAASAAEERHDEAEQAVEDGPSARRPAGRRPAPRRTRVHGGHPAGTRPAAGARQRARLAELAQRARDRARERVERLDGPD